MDVSDKEIAKMFFDGYFRRMWNNHEATYREEGFEEAWRKYKNDI